MSKEKDIRKDAMKLGLDMEKLCDGFFKNHRDGHEAFARTLSVLLFRNLCEDAPEFVKYVSDITMYLVKAVPLEPAEPGKKRKRRKL